MLHQLSTSTNDWQCGAYWRLLLVLAAVAALVLSLPTRLGAQEFPDPVGYVNDFAGVFYSDTLAGLEDALRLEEQETTAEIVVVTVQNLGGTTIEDYSVRLFKEWGIGKRGQDNGVLLVVAMEERDVRIEVGYGLEGVIPDGRAGRILDEAVLPEFREGNFALGILSGVYEIRLAIEDEGYSEPEADGGSSFVSGVIDFVITHLWLTSILTGLSIYMLSYMARTTEIWLGAIWGAIAGAVVGWVVAGALWGAVGIIPGAILGLILDAMLSAAYRGQVSSGHSSSWHRTWGGFGGMGRGGGFGGGFGGFGGGRSGGGGASRGF